MLFRLLPALYKLFVKQKADYYYVRMRSYLNLASYLAARKTKGKFLVALASDIDLLNLRDKYKYAYKSNFTLFKYLSFWLPNDLVFKFILKRADYIVKQHQGQAVNTRKVRGKVILFPNIINMKYLPVIATPSSNYYIYVGSLTMIKGADNLYEIVSNIDKNISIMIVGQPNDKSAKPIFEKLKNLVNANVKGRNEHRDTLKYLANAKALINTSEFEGFPNVFLESWAMGIPVLSYKVNPGNIFDIHNLGYCFKGDMKKMTEFINDKENCIELLDINRGKMISYVKDFHDFNTAADRFVSALNNSL